MFCILPAQTREYHPRNLEHWLHTIQNRADEKFVSFRELDGKAQITSSENLEEVLPGALCQKITAKIPSGSFFAKQTKGTLLPIKRYSQFEDRINKERIYSADKLFFELSRVPESFFKISFRPVSDRRRERALKKAKRFHFKPERRFDRWESSAWFSLKLRRFLGPPLRLLLSKIGMEKTREEKTETIHEREDPKSAILDKLSRPLFQVKIQMSHDFSNYLNGFTLPYLNGLKVSKKDSKMILSAEELATLLALPDTKTCAPFLHSESTAYLHPPPGNPLEMNPEDRKRHLYILGKTGMGKSSTLLRLFKSDLHKNMCAVLLDPHGDLAEDCLKIVPPERFSDLVILDPSNLEFPLALNPVELLDYENPGLKASAVTEIFQILAKGSWGPRLEYILRNAILTLLLNKNCSLMDLPRILTDKDFCLQKLQNIRDIELKRFWLCEFLNLEPKLRQEHVAPILNKVGPLLTSPALRNIFGQPKGKLNFKELFEKNKIVIIPLSKGKLGEDASRMLGMIFISMIQTSLLHRAAIPLEERKTLALYMDEFQNFCSPTLLSMLSESRKYGLALTLANQYINQIAPEYQDAVLGNVGSLIVFRTSFQDAEKLAPQLSLVEEDLCQTKPFQAYAKLLKNSECLPVFRFESQKMEPQNRIDVQPLINFCCQRFGRNRSLVEQKLMERYSTGMKKLLAAIFLALVLTLPNANAADPSITTKSSSNFNVFETLSTGTSGSGETTSENLVNENKDISPIANVILKAINILTLLIGTFAFVIIIVAGINMIIAQGDQNRIDRSKNMLSQALIGLVLAFTSYMIVTAIQSFFY